MDKHQKQLLVLAFRTIIIAIAIQKLLPHLLPHGPAVDILPQHRPAASKKAIDRSNKSLRLSSGKLTKIYERISEDDGQQERLLTLPETIIFDNKGTMYIMNENAKLVSLTDFQPMDSKNDNILTAKATEVADLGMGRPLGGKFDKKGCLYYADVLLGLARICNLPSSKSNVELLASRVRLDDGSWSSIMYADDVDIGPRTGHVYFSDASDVPTDRYAVTGKWDPLYSSKVEGVRGRRTGRLLRYKPETGEVDILATGVSFANGVAVDKYETYILYTSTFEVCVMKYYLKGQKAGTSERVLDNFPGFLDGADCSHKRGVCYVAIPSTLSLVVKAIFYSPSWLGKPLRTLLLMIPRAWSPNPEPYGAVAEIYPGDDDTPASILRIFQDPDGSDVNMITGVTEFEGKLYLGSLHNNYVCAVSLD